MLLDNQKQNKTTKRVIILRSCKSFFLLITKCVHVMHDLLFKKDVKNKCQYTSKLSVHLFLFSPFSVMHFEELSG